MLAALRVVLDITDSFDACVWAAAACAFWGIMRFGEVSVPACTAFRQRLHLTRADALLAVDLDGRPYARLALSAAKTAKVVEVQYVWLVEQGSLCPILALRTLVSVTPAAAHDPLFSWHDQSGDVRPLVKAAALRRINAVFTALGRGTTFGHSFRIGGASFYLSQKVDPEAVRLAGRWRSLAYEAYIRAFEQIASRHLANLGAAYGY